MHFGFENLVYLGQHLLEMIRAQSSFNYLIILGLNLAEFFCQRAMNVQTFNLIVTFVI
jgi:hypothetical protein